MKWYFDILLQEMLISVGNHQTLLTSS